MIPEQQRLLGATVAVFTALALAGGEVAVAANRASDTQPTSPVVGPGNEPAASEPSLAPKAETREGKRAAIRTMVERDPTRYAVCEKADGSTGLIIGTPVDPNTTKRMKPSDFKSAGCVNDD
jgi:hypothetical protein